MIARWPLREALVAYRGLMRQRALEHYRAELLRWSVLAPHMRERRAPPELPRVLELAEKVDDDGNA